MKITFAKRFAVRTVLVTGSTLAALLGAQALASLDQIAMAEAPPAIVVSAETPLQPDAASAFVLPGDAPAAAPDIVILRHPGQASAADAGAPSTTAANPASNPTVNIQPPNPVQVVVPQPVQQVVQPPSAPFQATTRSSR